MQEKMLDAGCWMLVQKGVSARREYHLWSIYSSLFAYGPQRVRCAHCSLELTKIQTFHCHRIYESEHYGASTKYLSYYLSWFRILAKTKEQVDRTKAFWTNLLLIPRIVTVSDVKNGNQQYFYT